MKVEAVKYSAGGLACNGRLVYDDSVKAQRPLLLVAPNWLGVTDNVIERAKELAGSRYTAFISDMFGEGKGPKGTENPMEFLKPLIEDCSECRSRMVAALDTMTKEATARGIGDASRRAAIGYCFGGSNVIELARTGADVAAVVSVHGVLATATPAKKGDIKAAILVLHGAADPISPRAHRDMFEDEMDASGARWCALYFGKVPHAYTDVGVNNPPVAVYSEPATRHGYALAHGFIADAFAGKL